MEPTLWIASDSIAGATRTLREQGMPPEEIETVLDVEEPQVLRTYMELHRQRLDERLAAERRALAGVERFLALAILERTDHPTGREDTRSRPTKEVRMTEHDVQVTAHRRKIGPVSAACRLALTGVTVWSAVNWTSAGIGWFSRTTTITDPGIWLLIGLGIYYGLYQTAASGFGQRWGIRTVIAFAVVLAGASVTAVVTEGELWASPLTWLPYGLVLWFFVTTAIAGPISLAQGTPGCEFGALGELIRRLRGVPEPERADAMWCIAGLHRIDAWEARRAEARERHKSRSPRSAGERRG